MATELSEKTQLTLDLKTIVKPSSNTNIKSKKKNGN